MSNLKLWQRVIRRVSSEKGFNWAKAEIDTMLLRLHSEISEAGEAARDIPINRTLRMRVTITNEDYPCGFTLGTDAIITLEGDNTFNTYFKQRLYPDRPLEVSIEGEIIEEFEPDDHVAEELADTFIRLVDTCEVLGIDLEKAVIEKYTKNKKRPPRHGRGRK